MEDDSEALVPVEPTTALDAHRQATRDYARASKASATWRAYRTDLDDFAAWCRHHNVEALPAAPETVAAYLSDLATRLKVSTVQRRVSAISQAHQAAGYETPTASTIVRLTMRGIQRTHAPSQRVRQAEPAVTATIRKFVHPLGDSLIDKRDRALLLIGFAGAFRRSELVALEVGDITETDDGLRIVLRQSKTDQEGEGMVKGLPYGSEEATCPVRAWRAWVSAAGITEGRAFRSVTRHGHVDESLSDKAIALVIKRRALAAGLDPKPFSGHSLRAGLATAAAQAGVSERAIMAQTGHKSLPMVRRYIREGSLFRENAAGKVGL
jgi:site-specific recombinase XerD